MFTNFFLEAANSAKFWFLWLSDLSYHKPKTYVNTPEHDEYEHMIYQEKGPDTRTEDQQQMDWFDSKEWMSRWETETDAYARNITLDQCKTILQATNDISNNVHNGLCTPEEGRAHLDLLSEVVVDMKAENGTAEARSTNWYHEGAKLRDTARPGGSAASLADLQKKINDVKNGTSKAETNTNQVPTSGGEQVSTDTNSSTPPMTPLSETPMPSVWAEAHKAKADQKATPQTQNEKTENQQENTGPKMR